MNKPTAPQARVINASIDANGNPTPDSRQYWRIVERCREEGWIAPDSLEVTDAGRAAVGRATAPAQPPAGVVKGASTTGTIHWARREARPSGYQGYSHLNQICGYGRAQHASLSDLVGDSAATTAVTCKRCIAKYGTGVAPEAPAAERTELEPASGAFARHLERQTQATLEALSMGGEVPARDIERLSPADAPAPAAVAPPAAECADCESLGDGCPFHGPATTEDSRARAIREALAVPVAAELERHAALPPLNVTTVDVSAWRPTEPATRPAGQPLTGGERADHYRRQRGTSRITPAQRRRLVKKQHRAAGQEAPTTATAAQP